MDALIEWFLSHPVTINFSPTILITWLLLYFVWRGTLKVSDSVSNIDKTLAATIAELKSLSANQKQMHDDNITLFQRNKK
jgi:hypothetical protein